MRKLLSLFLTLTLSAAAFAYTAQIDGIYYTFYSSNKTATVTYRDQNYNSYTGEVVIPASVEYNDEEYAVTSIGGEAFRSCSSLTAVRIPNSVKSIEQYAFYGCFGLTSIVIPDGVTSVEWNTFGDCSSLSSVTLPNSIKSIEPYAFRYCRSLTAITIPDGVTSVQYQTFEGCSGLTSIVIPDGVTSIGSSAFNGCSSLSSVVLPKNLISIGESAFRSTALTAIDLPQSVTSIGSCAFQYCRSLTAITIPDGVTSINSYTFEGCSALSSVVLPKNLISIGESAFNGNSSLTSITLPSTVNSIGSYAFSSSSSLSVSVLGETPASLGSNTFHENTIFYVPNVDTYKAAWTGYKFIVPFNGVSASVSISALADKSALQQKLGLDSLKKITSLTISGTINSYDIMMMRNQMPNLLDIDLSEASIVTNDYEYTKGYHSKKDTLTAYSFTGTGTHIRKAILPNTVTCIEQNVFNTPYLQEVVLPEGLLTIGEKTFYGCAALRSINLPESLTSIGESAFQGAGLTAVTIPANVQTIGEKAFAGGNEEYWGGHYYSSAYDNSQNAVHDLYPYGYKPYSGGSLQSVTIPADSKLTTISAWAFAGNNSLKKISILGDSIQSIQTGVFCYCRLDTLILPPNLTKLNTLSFGYCTGLKFIAMPNTLTKVADNAFVGCTSLDNIQFPKKLTKIGHHAFADCTNLRNVDIPGLVTDIEEYAFKDCNVKSIYSYLFDPFTIGQNTFSAYANANAVLYIPNLEDTEMKYLYDTQWSQFLNRYRMDKSFQYDDFYGKGDINFSCGDDPLKGKPNATLYPGAGLTVDADCDSTQHIGNVEIEGNGKDWASIIAGCNLSVDSLIQHIFVSGKKWHFFGFPFPVKIEDIASDAKYVIYEYDGQARAERDTTGWKRLPKDQQYLYPGHGYIFQFNFSVSGSFTIRIPSPDFCEAVKKVLLTFFPSKKENNKSWNYAANPFMAYYDINDLNTTSPITYWDVEEGTYKSVRPGDDEYYISPYEGFFLQNEFSEDFELVFERDKAMTKRQLDERRAAHLPARAAKAQSGISRYIINLTLSDGGQSDATRVVINEQAALGYDLGKDAAKFLSTEASVPQIFSYDDGNVQYAINERPMHTGTVELGLRLPASGVYTIDAPRMDTLFYLLDRENNTLHDFSNGAYTFSSGAGSQTGRFALVRGYNVPTSVEAESADQARIETTADGLYIHGTADIQVYNVAGVIVAEGTYSGSLPLPAGVYLVVSGDTATKCVIH